ncbi:hypothetical protein IWZ01DRAFT_484945 [Phyllosticta capitalensis]
MEPLPDDGSPLDLDDGTYTPIDFMPCILLIFTAYVKRFWARKIVLHYEKIRHTCHRRPFADQRMAHDYLEVNMRGRLLLPVFKNHDDAEALEVLCLEALKDLVSMGYMTLLQPLLPPLPRLQGQAAGHTQNLNKAHDGTTKGRIAATVNDAATQDSVPATKGTSLRAFLSTITLTNSGISAEWESHLFYDAAVPEVMRPLRFSNREAACWYMINTVSAKRSLPVTDTPEIKEVWRLMCQEALLLLEDEGHFEYLTHMELRQQETARAQAEAEEKSKALVQARALASRQCRQAQKQEIRAAEATRVASCGADFQRGHAAGFAAGPGGVQEAGREVGKDAGQAAGMIAAKKRLSYEQPTLDSVHSTTHVRSSPAPDTVFTQTSDVGIGRIDTNDSVERINGQALNHMKSREGSNSGQFLSATDNFVKTSLYHPGSIPSPLQSQSASIVFGFSTQLGQSDFKQSYQHAGQLSGNGSMKSSSGKSEPLQLTGATGLDRKPKRRLSRCSPDSEELRALKKARD